MLGLYFVCHVHVLVFRYFRLGYQEFSLQDMTLHKSSSQ